MKPARLMFTVLALASACTSAQGADTWKDITLRGEEGFTISVPSAANNKPDLKDPNDFMFIALEAGLHGSLVCMAQRMEYPQGTKKDEFAAALKTARREVFCQNDRASPGTLSIESSRSFQRDGVQAAVCTASYFDEKAKSPGQVQSQMVMAASSGIYVLTCTLEDEEQELAEYEWSSFWGENVRRIQDSFHLPASRR